MGRGARRGDANRDRLQQARGHRFVPHGDGQVADAHNHRVGAILVARRGSTPSVHSEVGGDERRADPGASEVDRQDRPLVQLVHVPLILREPSMPEPGTGQKKGAPGLGAPRGRVR